MKCHCTKSAGNGKCHVNILHHGDVPEWKYLDFFYTVKNLHPNFYMFKCPCETFFPYISIIYGICTWKMYVYNSHRYVRRCWHVQIACCCLQSCFQHLHTRFASMSINNCTQFFHERWVTCTSVVSLFTNKYVITVLFSSFKVLLPKPATFLCQGSIGAILKDCESVNSFCIVPCLSWRRYRRLLFLTFFPASFQLSQSVFMRQTLCHPIISWRKLER